MVYNFKVTEFENGCVEVRKYSRPIGAEAIYINTSEITSKRKRTIEELKENDTSEWSELVDNPFTGRCERLMRVEYEDVVKARHERSVASSRSRTVNQIYNISRSCVWEYFITLTFSPELIDRYDFEKCMKSARKWFNNQKTRYASDLQYLVVPEMHKDGAWHVHGVLANVGNMVFSDSGRRASGKIIYNLSGWKYGFSTATVVSDVDRVSSYIIKYITKDLCLATFGKQRYFRSNNIPKPKETYFLVCEDEVNSFFSPCEDDISENGYLAETDILTQTIVDSLGCELVYEKDVNGFLSVNYKYFKRKG